MTTNRSTPSKFKIHHSSKTYSYSPEGAPERQFRRTELPSFISLKNERASNTLIQHDASKMFFSQTSLRNKTVNAALFSSAIDLEHQRMKSKDIENKRLI